MKKLSLLSQTVAIALLAVPFSSQADSWSCRHDNNVREVHVQSASATSDVPCSVVYKKLTEGVEDRVLWTAQNDAAYCADKAKAFIEKQVGWGWTCVETIADDGTTTATETETEEDPAETTPAETAPAAATETAAPAAAMETAAPEETGSSITTP